MTEPTKPEPITIREAIETYRGSFYKQLLRAHDEATIFELCLAYKRADPQHQAVLQEHFPDIDTVANALVSRWPLKLAGRLEVAFPGLRALDEQTDMPTEFDLLEEQAPAEAMEAP